MPNLLSITKFIIGKDLRISSNNEQFVKALLTDSKQCINTPSESLSNYIAKTKGIVIKTPYGNFSESVPLPQPITLFEYNKLEKTPIQARGVFSGKKGDCYIRTFKDVHDHWNKSCLVKIGDDYEPACWGWGHFYDKRGFRTDPNPVHPIERTLGLDKFKVEL